MSSIISRAPSSNHSTGDSPSPEESGWTTYLEDFFNDNNKNSSERCYSISSGVANSFTVSDAASLAAKKFSDREHGDGDECPPVRTICRTSSFKKRKKTKAALFDDALEDTASSPVNSPKEIRGSTFRQYESKELGFNARDSTDCTELKKRGLCLVPLSMAVKYLG